MFSKKCMTAGFLVAALAGCQSGDEGDGVFSCTSGERGASVILLDQGAKLTLTEHRVLTIYPYMRGNKTIYRDVTGEASVDALKEKARAYCSTGVLPR